MIQAIGLTSLCRRGGEPAVDDLTFEAAPGGITGLFGAPGSGKSTTLRLMLELQPGRGVALFDGRPMHRLRHPAREVGVLLGDVPGNPTRTARGHLQMLAAAAGVPAARADEALELVGLAGVARQRLDAFSLGMDRRLGLAAALLGDPHTLVLDDPAAGLSPREAAWVHALLRAFADQGGTVLLASGSVRELTAVADHVVSIDRGRLIADQPASEFARTRLRPRVVVRSPQAHQLAHLLAAEGAEVVKEGGACVSVFGAQRARVGETAFRHGILLHELADHVVESSVPLQPRAGQPSPVPIVAQGGAPSAAGASAPEVAAVAQVAHGPAETGAVGGAPAAGGPAAGTATKDPAPAGTTLTGEADDGTEAADEPDDARPAEQPPTAQVPQPSRGDGTEGTPAATAAPAPPPAPPDADPAATPTPGTGDGNNSSDGNGNDGNGSNGNDGGSGGDETPEHSTERTTEIPVISVIPVPAVTTTPTAPADADADTATPQEPTPPPSSTPTGPPLPVALADYSAEEGRRRGVVLPGPTWLLRYEWRRLSGIRSTWLILAGALVAGAAVALLLGRSPFAASRHEDMQRLLTAWAPGLPLPPAAFGAGLLGALAFGQEFRYPALAPAQVAVPRRFRLLLAKMAVGALGGLVLAGCALTLNAVVVRYGVDPPGEAVPEPVLPLVTWWSALVVGSAWAGLLAAGVFRSSLVGALCVLAVPVLVEPVVRWGMRMPWLDPTLDLARHAARTLTGGWEYPLRRAAEAVHVLAAGPVEYAFALSVLLLLLVYVFLTVRRRTGWRFPG
ncbi:hypothetical protein GCM10027168_39390 [Streptomyces capparidis]